MNNNANIPILPYSKVVGHNDLKLSMEINYISGSRLGGVLISGHRGTGKSTAVRAFTQMMFSNLPVTLPINATEDRVIGGYKIDALMKGDPKLQDGLLVQANGQILYIDEVNLLDDHIVNIILDTAATGILTVQRQGLDIPARETRFALIGTMNPEEGHLRPQLRDRFGLMVHITTCAEDRASILKVILDFDYALAKGKMDTDFLIEARSADTEIKERLETAQQKMDSIIVSDTILQKCVDLANRFEAVGHRADYFLALAARAQAARMSATGVASEHLRDIAPLVLTHRRHEQSEKWSEEDNRHVAEILTVEPNTAVNLSQQVTQKAS